MTIKAVRATIKLGDIELDVFQLPDGTYRYDYQFLADIIGRDKTILSNKKSPYALQNILGKDKTEWNTKLGGISKGYTYNSISSSSLLKVFSVFSSLGHENVVNLLLACAEEALERRADSAFNVVRSEEERNSKLAARIQGKQTRRKLTDAISDWLDNEENDASENSRKFMYSNCSDSLNNIVLGYKARVAKEILGVSEHSLLRDYLPMAAISELDAVERLACILIDEDNMNPVDAVKQASISVRAKRVDL